MKRRLGEIGGSIGAEKVALVMPRGQVREGAVVSGVVEGRDKIIMSLQTRLPLSQLAYMSEETSHAPRRAHTRMKKRDGRDTRG